MSRIRDLLSRDIRSGKLSPGARLPTVRDIARSHSVSVATAGRVIQRLEQEGLVDTSVGNGAFVSSRASSQKQLSLFLCLHPALLMNRGHELAFSTLQGVITAAENQGASLLPVTTRENIVLDELSRHSSGLVLLDHNYEIDGFGGVAAFAVEHGRPVCIAGPTSSDIPGVAGDHQEAFELATDHLLGLGHRRIALINHIGLDGREDLVVQANRQGYLRAFRKRHLSHPPELYAEAVASESGQFRAQTAAALDRLLEQRPRLTAIVCNNDLRAFLILELLAERGLRVPQDISVAGFDNRRAAAQCSPPLTTVDPRRFAQGEAAVQYVIHCLRGGSGAPTRVHPRLIERESAGPVN